MATKSKAVEAKEAADNLVAQAADQEAQENVQEELDFDALTEQQEALAEKIKLASEGRVTKVKAELDKLAKHLKTDWYGVLGLAAPAPELPAELGVGGDGDEPEKEKKERKRNGPGMQKSGVVYSIPADFKKPDGSEWEDANMSWQTGARGVPNPKPAWLEAYINTPGNKWRDLEPKADKEDDKK